MEGISRLLKFLSDVAANNNREWFQANKDEYLAVTEIRNRLASELIAAVATVDPSAARLTEKDCTYRIYRDVRFSHDKRPYKTHIGIFINPPYGKKSSTCGYYFHLEPENCFVAAGTIGLDNKILKAIRKSILDNIDEYRAIVESDSFRKLYPTLGDNFLKRAPQGFPSDWPYLKYVMPKDFLACSANLDPLFKEGEIDALMPYIIEAFRFNRFMNYTIEDFIP